MFLFHRGLFKTELVTGLNKQKKSNSDTTRHKPTSWLWIWIEIHFFTHNLQFDSLPLHFNSSDFEIYPNSADVALCIGVILVE